MRSVAVGNSSFCSLGCCCSDHRAEVDPETTTPEQIQCVLTQDPTKPSSTDTVQQVVAGIHHDVHDSTVRCFMSYNCACCHARLPQVLQCGIYKLRPTRTSISQAVHVMSFAEKSSPAPVAHQRVCLRINSAIENKIDLRLYQNL